MDLDWNRSTLRYPGFPHTHYEDFRGHPRPSAGSPNSQKCNLAAVEGLINRKQTAHRRIIVGNHWCESVTLHRWMHLAEATALAEKLVDSEEEDERGRGKQC